MSENTIDPKDMLEKDKTAEPDKPVEINKNIVILMPFRSRNKQGRMQSKLERKRIKHIVEDLIDVFVTWNETEIKINYNVKVALTVAGDVKNVIENEFEEADIFIALVTQRNVNVVYEIAIVNVLQKNIILLLDGPASDLPVYFEGYARIDFYDTGDDGDDQKIYDTIKQLSEDELFIKEYGKTRSPTKIANFLDIIKQNDTRLIDHLQEAIEKYEQKLIKPPQSFRRLVRDFHPSRTLTTWDTFLPTSVIRANWKPVNPETNEYDSPDPLINTITVCSCNFNFMQFLGSAKQNVDDFVTDKPLLTAERQMNMLGKYISDENEKWFIRDQTRIFDALFLRDQPARAYIPLEFNQTGKKEHPHKAYRGKIFMPILVGKKVVGVKSSEHTTYYLIVFVEDFFPFKEIPDYLKEQIPG